MRLVIFIVRHVKLLVSRVAEFIGGRCKPMTYACPSGCRLFVTLVLYCPSGRSSFDGGYRDRWNKLQAIRRYYTQPMNFRSHTRR
jgi:hypothetical protein